MSEERSRDESSNRLCPFTTAARVEWIGLGGFGYFWLQK